MENYYARTAEAPRSPRPRERVVPTQTEQPRDLDDSGNRQAFDGMGGGWKHGLANSLARMLDELAVAG